MEQKLFQKGKICLDYVAIIIASCNAQNIVNSRNKSKKLIREMMEWAQAYIAWTATLEDNPEEYLGATQIIAELRDAQENGDMILFSDIAELKLRPMLYQVQAMLLGQGVEYVSFPLFSNNVRRTNEKNPVLCEKIGLALQCGTDEEVLSLYNDLCEQYVASGILEPSSSGYPTFAFVDGDKRYYAHSNVNPVWEAYSQARYYYTPEQDKYLLYGLGLGYLISQLLYMDRDINLTIYEGDLDIIRMAFLCTDISWLWEENSITLLYDSDIYRLSDYLEGDYQVVIHEPSMRHMDNDKIRQLLQDILIRDTNQRNSKDAFLLNFRRNIENCQHYIDELKPEFQNKHAVIVAAGPSLDKNIDKLRLLPKDTLIIATGTIFRRFVKMGIIPDYVIFTDQKRKLHEQITGLLEEQIPLLVLSTTYYKVAKDYQGEKYLICQNGVEASEAYALSKGYTLYETGGSVTTTALDVCIRLGCTEVAFLGLDLSYTNYQSHAGGTGKSDVAGGMKLLKAEKGVLGDTVYLAHSFEKYRDWMEQRILEIPKENGCKVIDATEGGCIKKGMMIMDMDSVIERWNQGR